MVTPQGLASSKSNQNLEHNFLDSEGTGGSRPSQPSSGDPDRIEVVDC